MIYGEADLVSAALAQCCRRDEVVDYLWTISEYSFGFVIKSENDPTKPCNRVPREDSTLKISTIAQRSFSIVPLSNLSKIPFHNFIEPFSIIDC